MNSNNSIAGDEVVLRKSLFVLVLRGAWAWLIILMLSIIADQVILMLQNSYSLPYISLLNGRQISFDSIFRFVLLLFYGAMLLYVVLSWVMQYFVIREHDVIKKSGILIINESEMDLEEVDSVKVHQGVLGRFFDFGRIELHNPRVGETMVLESVKHPHQIANKIESLVFEYKQHRA